MLWTGKVVGSLLGMATGLGAVGAAVGFVIGHGVDERRAASRARRKLAESGPDPVAIQQVFFRSTFEVMGHVARSRGRITEQNIAAAEEIFRQFGLDRQAMHYAIDCFRVGKQPVFHYKLGRATEPPLDTLSFAYTHKYFREVGMLDIGSATDPLNQGWHPDLMDVPFTGEDYLRYLFITVVEREPMSTEMSGLVSILTAAGFDLNNASFRTRITYVVLDYLSRLPEMYLTTTRN